MNDIFSAPFQKMKKGRQFPVRVVTIRLLELGSFKEMVPALAPVECECVIFPSERALKKTPTTLQSFRLFIFDPNGRVGYAAEQLESTAFIWTHIPATHRAQLFWLTSTYIIFRIQAGSEPSVLNWRSWEILQDELRLRPENTWLGKSAI